MLFIRDVLAEKCHLYIADDNTYIVNIEEGSLSRQLSESRVLSARKVNRILLKRNVLLGGKKVEFSEYNECIEKRCIQDINIFIKEISKENISIIKKYRLLKKLIGSKQIRNILHKENKHTRLGKVSFYPSVMVMRYIFLGSF